MKVEPVSVRSMTGPRRSEADTRTAASSLPNSTTQDFSSFDSIEISNPVAPPDQVIGAGAALNSSSIVAPEAAIPYVEPTPEQDMREPSLASMLRTIKGYLAEDFQQAVNHHQDTQVARQADAQAAQVQTTPATPSAGPAQPVKPTQPGEKHAPAAGVDFAEPGSKPAIPRPPAGFKDATVAQPKPIHTESAKPVPVKQAEAHVSKHGSHAA